MRTYKVELRHAPSKNKLNAIRGNRLPPLTARLVSDETAIVWARDELMGLCRRKHGTTISTSKPAYSSSTRSVRRNRTTTVASGAG